jgi:hypothetical protein
LNMSKRLLDTDEVLRVLRQEVERVGSKSELASSKPSKPCAKRTIAAAVGIVDGSQPAIKNPALDAGSRPDREGRLVVAHGRGSPILAVPRQPVPLLKRFTAKS